jgi:signal transduction histidine kinase
LPQVDADPDALITVLLNLLDNAFKYTNQDKHIVLRAFADNGHVCFEVQDNGIGLSRRAAQKVFERFYRVDDELSRSAEGSGLGLSIVRFIVDAHGGTVTVRSELGEGSTFTVRLPALAPVEVFAGAPFSAQRRPGDGSQTHET